jgi:hypothetical protein
VYEKVANLVHDGVYSYVSLAGLTSMHDVHVAATHLSYDHERHITHIL